LFCALAVVLAAAVMTVPAFASDGEDYASPFYATWLSLLPPVIAIGLALITKEVYSSLFAGIVVGALLYANFNPEMAITSLVGTLISSVGDSYNVGILIFLVILGAFVSIMNKAGGSGAYGRWAAERIKSRKGALLSTMGLGVLIFIDDYFNCLTVGSVMMPVTDKFKISRSKLAYIIDATAAPVCIIAPISSWAAAVSSTAEGAGMEGITLFMRTIPYNLYALLTLAMIIMITLMGFDYGKMKRHEYIAEKTGNLFAGGANEYATDEGADNKKGYVIDLILPVLLLIACCVVGMIYSGGFFEGASFQEAFANTDASVGLSLGSVVALLLMALLYLPRRVISIKDFCEGIPAGFRAMVPAILILTFAWTLAGFCRSSLGAGDFVGSIVQANAGASAFLPMIMFLIAVGLSFATGTSWGTFGILIPIATAIFPQMNETLIITISACLAGAVCGDHISPISDTTIMSSSGAQCNHIDHVSTQIPYGLTVAGVCVVGYVIAGFVQNPWVPLVVGLAVLFGVLLYLKNAGAKQPLPSLEGVDVTFVKQPEKKESEKTN
jgi:Na+/H+ antiporter NhaC